VKFSGSGPTVIKALVVWLGEAPYSLTTRFERGKGTEPEDKLAAAHAGCFTAAAMRRYAPHIFLEQPQTL
jgi:hypothetical protein